MDTDTDVTMVPTTETEAQPSNPLCISGLEIHAHVIKSGYYSDIFIYNSLLNFYVVANDIVSACRIFDLMSFPDVVSWTSIISGLSKCGFEEEAIVKFCSMDVKPNTITLVSVMSACSSLRALKLGKAIHGYSLRNLDESNIILDNVILDFYVRCGSLVSAKYLFVNMLKRDVVSWTTMVGGYAQRGFSEEAVRVFREMVEGGEAQPNEATIVNVLSACSSIGALSLGQWVHSYIDTRSDLPVEGNIKKAIALQELVDAIVAGQQTIGTDGDEDSKPDNISMAGDVSTWGHALVKISLSVSSHHLGEEQKKLDVLSNEVFSKALKFLTELIMIFMRVWIFFHCILISEEANICGAI
ncbi:pentatricopeptide repeat-containing protein At1g08070, chloroplastic-like [Fagus crenata]